MNLRLSTVAVWVAASSAVALAACTRPSTKEKVKDAAKAVGEDVKDAARKTGDAIKEAARETKEAVKDAAEKTADKLDEDD